MLRGQLLEVIILQYSHQMDILRTVLLYFKPGKYRGLPHSSDMYKLCSSFIHQGKLIRKQRMSISTAALSGPVSQAAPAAYIIINSLR